MRRQHTARRGAPYRCVDPIAPLDRRLYIQPESARSCHLCYSHWAAWSSAPDPSLNSRCPHARLLLPKACAMLAMRPWTLDPRTSTMLAHGPVPGPRFRISNRAAPQRLTAPPHHSAPRAAQHSLHSGTAHTSLHRAPLCTAPLLHLYVHLSAPRTSLHLSVCSLQLPELGVEPTVQSAGSTHSPSRQVTSFGMQCLPERPFSVPLRRQGAAAAQQGGGQACQLDRT